jgi:hypothetical protein
VVRWRLPSRSVRPPPLTRPQVHRRTTLIEKRLDAASGIGQPAQRHGWYANIHRARQLAETEPCRTLAFTRGPFINLHRAAQIVHGLEQDVLAAGLTLTPYLTGVQRHAPDVEEPSVAPEDFQTILRPLLDKQALDLSITTEASSDTVTFSYSSGSLQNHGTVTCITPNNITPIELMSIGWFLGTRLSTIRHYQQPTFDIRISWLSPRAFDQHLETILMPQNADVLARTLHWGTVQMHMSGSDLLNDWLDEHVDQEGLSMRVSEAHFLSTGPLPVCDITLPWRQQMHIQAPAQLEFAMTRLHRRLAALPTPAKRLDLHTLNQWFRPE